MNKETKYISIDPEKSNLKEVHNLLLGGVAPRPIALVSTISEDGINNLAPFSFFNAFGANPPYVAFSPSYSGRDGSAKDTLINVKKIPECVVQVVSHSMVEQASLASTAYPSEVDEFVKSGFTPVDSNIVKPKRVKESPFQMECKVEQIIPLGGTNGSGNLVICRVVMFHVNEGIYKNGQINTQGIDLVGRNSGNYYTRASGNAIFEVNKPTGLGIGIDALPGFIRSSTILSPAHLAQLGGLKELPQKNVVESFMQTVIHPKNGIVTENKPEEEYITILKSAYSFFKENEEMAVSMIETAASKALDKQEVLFSICALLSIPIARKKFNVSGL